VSTPFSQRSTVSVIPPLPPGLSTPGSGGFSFFAFAVLASAVCGSALSPVPLGAQASEAWNTDAARELVARARAERHRTRADSGLRTYRARARGHVYFLADVPTAGERSLIKADQFALELYWRAPGEAHQRIVGRRDAKTLPTTVRYHLDHLTVVTDDFDDRIEVGDGHEVRSVLHPLAPGSDAHYDFRLVDSVTIRFPGPREDVPVYELDVRPRDPERPAYLGKLFLDRRTGGVVRMNFTFTPASYVDPSVDRIQISLENGLWEERYGLPYREEVEVRRELSLIDFPLGSVIQIRWRVGGYELNPELPEELFEGPSVTSVSREEAERYPFEEDLFAQVEAEGLGPPPSLERIREDALRSTELRPLTGLGKVRLFLPNSSSFLRFNRAEGYALGGGASYQPLSLLTLQGHGGWAFGREEPHGSIRITGGELRPGTGIELVWNDPRDVGSLLVGASRLTNTLSSLVLDTDYLDPYFATGVRAFHRWRPSRLLELEIRGAVEEVDSARNVVSGSGSTDDFRPVRPVPEGREIAGELVARAGPSGDGLSAEARIAGADFDGTRYGAFRGRLAWERRWLDAGVDLSADLHGGAVTSGAPAHRLFLLGGRRTLPGYEYRSRVGDSFWLLRLSGSWGLAEPWVRGRLFGSAGGTDLSHRPLPRGWTGGPTPVTLFSAGLGVGLLWDVLHLDLGRGLNGGSWQLNAYVSQRFWPWL